MLKVDNKIFMFHTVCNMCTIVGDPIARSVNKSQSLVISLPLCFFGRSLWTFHLQPSTYILTLLLKKTRQVHKYSKVEHFLTKWKLNSSDMSNMNMQKIPENFLLIHLDSKKTSWTDNVPQKNHGSYMYSLSIVANMYLHSPFVLMWITL